MVRVWSCGRPHSPAGCLDMAPDVGVLEHDAGIVPPRAAEILGPSSNNCAFVDHIVISILRTPSRGGDPPGADRLDCCSGNPQARALAKDKVGRAVDVALANELKTFVPEVRVLIPSKLDAIPTKPRPIDAKCDGLGTLSICVRNVDIV